MHAKETILGKSGPFSGKEKEEITRVREQRTTLRRNCSRAKEETGTVNSRGKGRSTLQGSNTGGGEKNERDQQGGEIGFLPRKPRSSDRDDEA